jgi:hypothetical protein
MKHFVFSLCLGLMFVVSLVCHLMHKHECLIECIRFVIYPDKFLETQSNWFKSAQIPWNTRVWPPLCSHKMKIEMGDVPFDEVLTDTILVWITIIVGCIMLAWCGGLSCVFCENCALVKMFIRCIFIQVFINILCAGIYWRSVLTLHSTLIVFSKKMCSSWDFDHHECSSWCPSRKSWS